MSCRQYLDQLKKTPPLEGDISIEYGFMPIKKTSTSLPSSHQLWDEIGAQLSELFGSNKTQSILENLPILPASEKELPNSALKRASVLLSAMAHAYWRFGCDRFFPQRITQVSTALPDSILVPWKTVCSRLNRHNPEQPFQSFYDLFLSNYQLKKRPATETIEQPPIIDNIEILVSTFNNEAERVFYGSFIEMHYHFTPIVKAVCNIEQGVNEHDDALIVESLQQIGKAFSKATSVWNKISPNPGAKTFCDPILWSKTVAILGVPPEGVPQGATSGSCSPVLYLMDSLLGRKNFQSHYGSFMKDTAQFMVAKSVHKFSELASKISLIDYIHTRTSLSNKAALQQALTDMVYHYMGETGWLGRHTAKVFNYLCISTITGRNASVSGHERYFDKQTWVTASEELQDSRRERLPSEVAQQQNNFRLQHAKFLSENDQLLAELPEYSLLEVTTHHNVDDLWIIIDQHVYDITHFSNKHPGGTLLLHIYAGHDATKVFWSQHVHQNVSIFKLLRKYLIGRLAPQEEEYHKRLMPVLYSMIQCKHVLKMQYEHSMEGHSALKLYSDENTHMMFWHENLKGVFNLLKPKGWDEISTHFNKYPYYNNMQYLSSSDDLRGKRLKELNNKINSRRKNISQFDLQYIEKIIAHSFLFLEEVSPQSDLTNVLIRWFDLIISITLEESNKFDHF